MDLISILLISLIVVITGFGIAITVILVKQFKHTNSLIDESNALRVYMQDKQLQDKSVEYSKSIMELGRIIAAQASITRFREYIDNHQTEKLTLKQLAELINLTASNINISIDYDQIDFSRTVFNKSYFEQLLIDTVVNTMKDLFEKRLEEY